jgi:hypothetical protein
VRNKQSGLLLGFWHQESILSKKINKLTMLSKALRHADDKCFRSIDRMAINAFPEIRGGDVDGIDPTERYRSFYFDNDYPDDVLKNERGIIMLHNSWTPDDCKKMTESEFLSQDITLSKLLKSILGIGIR